MHSPFDSAPIRPHPTPLPAVELIERSSREIVQRYALEPNDANTWAAIRAALSNYLVEMWAQGKLVGSKASESFAVTCGLGSTMTQMDVLNGELIAVLQVAVVHPAEFTVVTIRQTMQTAA